MSSRGNQVRIFRPLSKERGEEGEQNVRPCAESYVEPDLHITVKGLDETTGNRVGNCLANIVCTLAEGENALDFRRMHRIIVTNNFAGELAELSTATASGNLIEHTNEEYAAAVAIVLLLPRGDGIEIVPVLSAQTVVGLVSEDPSYYETETFRSILHLVHHELCHVHDDNKKLDAFPEAILKKSYEGKDRYIRPLAEICWSEYIANRLSSSTAQLDFAAFMTTNFSGAIPRTKPLVNEEILAYRRHGDLNRLLKFFGRHGDFLPKAASYTCGYLDGFGITLRELLPEADECLQSSYFEQTWYGMRAALGEMYSMYPGRWKDLLVYDQLATVLETYFGELGLFFTNLPDGEVYVEVPFRPETMA